MVFDTVFNDVQTSLARIEAMPKINQLLNGYGIDLPKHDPKTGLIASTDLAKLLDTVSGSDAISHRAKEAPHLLVLLRHAGLSGIA